MISEKDANIKWFSSYYFIILWGIFMVFIFSPFEIFLSNRNNFDFGIYDLFPFAIMGVVFGSVGSILFMKVIAHVNCKAAEYIAGLIFALLSAFYLQGNFLRTDYGQLNGEAVDWSHYPLDMLISVILWIGLIIGIVLCIKKIGYKKMDACIKMICICICIIQAITLGTLLLTTGGFEKKEVVAVTDRNEFCLSNQKNLIVLVLDSFDSRALDTILMDEEADEYKNILKDFTFFRNTVGSYTFTDVALPHIITGNHYSSDMKYGEYVEKSYQEAFLLSYLCEKNWEIGIYTLTDIPQGKLPYEVDNFNKVELTVSSKKRLAQYIYKLIGYRYLPFPLKQFCWFYPDEVNDLTDIKGEEVDYYGWSNQEFYDEMNKITADIDNPVFRFYHIDGTHIPFTMHRNVFLTGESTGKSSLEEEARAMMVLVERYLGTLKEQDIYDNSAIVIMADHGYYGFRQSPLLLIKGMNEEHQFTVSENPIWYDQLQSIFVSLSEGTQSQQIFDGGEGEKERDFFSYDLDESGSVEKNEQYLPVTKFSILGHSTEDKKVVVN